MSRLPTPGGDENTWGTILNDFLAASHNTDGSLKPSAISGAIGDASTIAKGVVQLAGDLGGTAASPTVPGLGTHVAATTSVHGIANTANLETTTGAQAKVDAHVNDTSAAHAASAISFTPVGAVAATDAQAAIAEVSTDAATALSTHAADATIHTSGREIQYTTVTSSQSGLNALAGSFAISNVTGMTVTIPAGGTRPVHLIARIHMSSDTADTGITVGIMPSAGASTADAIGGGFGMIATTTANVFQTIIAEARLAPGTSGTYKVTVSVSSGSATSNASVFAPAVFKAVEA